MNTISQTEVGIMAGYPAAAGSPAAAQDKYKTEKEPVKEASGKKTSRVTNGKTIGQPELSDKAKKYYEQLKKKYANMDFILVSEDMKAQAQANAGSYADANRMVVLIDTEKIERMAEDEEYRKQYEGIISGAASRISQFKNNLGASAGYVKTYGMKVNDGGNASFFAVVDQSMAAQRERITQKAARKKEENRQAKKKAEKERAEERMEQKRAEKQRKEKQAEKAGAGEPSESFRTDRTDDSTQEEVTVTASSMEELTRKINDTVYSYMSDNMRTNAERQLGQKFDFSI